MATNTQDPPPLSEKQKISRNGLDDFQVMALIISKNPHLKEKVLRKIRIHRAMKNDSIFEEATKKQKKVQNS